MIKVAAAGPISNFILAFSAIFLCVILVKFGVLSPYLFEVLISEFLVRALSDRAPNTDKFKT